MLLLLSSCAAGSYGGGGGEVTDISQITWQVPNTPAAQSQFKKDDFQCQMAARNARLGLIRNLQIYQQCMVAQGYTPGATPSSRP
jgi:hypothetical protein